jgi:UDP-glucose 4-epimerase
MTTRQSDLQTLTYLVTGGAGFVGSHLIETLLAQGHRVLAIDDLSTGRTTNIRHLAEHPNFHFARANINDEIVLDRLTSEADVVVHLAAAVGVKLIVQDPVHTIEANVLGTEAVLKAALRYGCRVLIASTSEVYGKGAKVPFNEEDDVVLGATSKNRWSYAASKMVDEFLGFAYQHEYGLPVAIFRLFNTVGPRQTGHYGMVIPRFVEQALKNKPITVYGDGRQSRCFCDVSDAVRAIAGLAEHPAAPGKTYNVGSTEEISISELAELIKTMTRSQSDIVYVPYSKAYEFGFEDMQRRVPDIQRIDSLFGWKPKHTLESILHKVIDSWRVQI